MKYDQPQKCLELNDGKCHLTESDHVCTLDVGHQERHACDCGATWEVEENLL